MTALREIHADKKGARRLSEANLDFGLMSLTYKFRDLLLPRMGILKEAGIEAGFRVLDYGCGPGSYLCLL